MKTDRVRTRRSPLTAIVVGVGLAVAAGGAWLYRSTQPAAPDLTATVEPLRQRVTQALTAAATELEAPARTAAAVPELRAAWKMGADRTTVQDLLENEEWWAPVRSRFPISAIVNGRGALAELGPSIGDIGATEVVKAARARGSASGLLAANGRAYLSAAARIQPARGDEKAAAAADLPVVLVGSPLDQGVLQGVAGQTGDVIGLSDGKSLVAITGPPSSRALATSLVGHERDGAIGLAGGRAGIAWSAGEGVWLLGISAPVPLPTRDQSGLWIAMAGLGLAVVALIFGLLLGARGSARPNIQQAITETAPVAGGIGTAEGRPAPELPQPGPLGPGAMARVPGTMAYRPTTAAGGAEQAAARVAPVHDGPGQMGRYRLIERIGEGGMAEIFLAAAYGAEDFVRYFVVKRMHAHLSRRREVVDQFIDEARLQAGLVHSNIVPVFDFGKAEDEEYFLALEYIHGRDIAKVVQAHMETQSGPLPEPIACYVVHEVLEALAFAHSQVDKEGRRLDIVHRDVAPGNVVTSYLGEVKLTDFGIAKAGQRVSRTEVGVVKGNAQFMSPEQARGEVVDARSDIFSAGLVLYYCLTGQVLYQSETTANSLLRAAVGPVTAEFSQIGLLSAPVAEILRRSLAQDPAKRYQTAEAFKRDLTPHAGTRRELAALMDRLFPVADRRDLR